MPATPIQPLITDAGLAAAIAAQGTGLTLQITHVQIGTGAYALNLADGSPDFARTALVSPTEKNTIAGGYRDANRFRVDVLFDPWTGTPATYGVSEVGFWAGDPDAGGVLFALWAQPTVFAQRNMLTYLATFNLVLSRVPAASVSVVIDPDLALALALVSDHESAQDPHPQYVEKAGDNMTGPLTVPTPAQFDASTKAATMEALQRALGNWRYYTSIAPSVLDVNHVGGVYAPSAAGNYTLPDTTGLPRGSAVAFVVRVAGVVIKASGAQAIHTNEGVSVTSISPTLGDTVLFVTDGITWDAVINTGRSVRKAGDTMTGALGLADGSTAPTQPPGDASTKLATTEFMQVSRTGEVALVIGATPNNGSIKANGAILSRTTYARLWAWAQAHGVVAASDAAWASGFTGLYSPGDGATTFRIPDLRGYHLRMADDGRGVDVGRGIGSVQADQLLAHAHGVNDPSHAHSLNDPAHAHGISQNPHAHGVTDPTHAHGVSDPTHAHNYTAEQLGAVGGAEGGARDAVGQATATTAASATGVTVNAAATGISIQAQYADVAVNAAGTGMSMNGAFTGISIQNSSGGSEVRVKNIAVLACIYY